MNGTNGERDVAEAGSPRELPEHLFRKSDDWKFLTAARRKRRREWRKARLTAMAEAVRDNAALVSAVAAPVAVLVLGWLIGAVRW